jgi:hypothetical protein
MAPIRILHHQGVSQNFRNLILIGGRAAMAALRFS